MQLLHVTFGKSHSVAWLRPIYLIYNMLCWRNWLGLKIGKNKTNKQTKNVKPVKPVAVTLALNHLEWP